jgi:pimeloyl-ACP methyl ester carboxylesterase
MQLVVQNLITDFKRVGKGRKVLILHGWGDSGAGWTQFAQSLAKDFDVVTLDLPGFGNTQPPPAPWGLTDYAEFVAAFIKKSNLEPYAVVGHSNGGAIAIRGMAKGLLTPERLVLLASSGVRGEYNGRTKALRLLTKTGKLLASPLPATVKKHLRSKVYETVGSDMLVAEHLQETFRLVVTDDVRKDAKTIRQPTLLVYGEHDQATPVRYGYILQHAIAGSRLEILPATEHFLHIERAAKAQQLTREFLR